MKNVVMFLVCFTVINGLYGADECDQEGLRQAQEEAWRLGVDLTFQGYSQEYINACQLYCLIGAQIAEAWKRGASESELSGLEMIRLSAQANMIAFEAREKALLPLRK